MKPLLAVARLVTRHKLRKLDVLSAGTPDEAPASKFRELYDALHDGRVRTDREAARLLYDAEPGDPRYRQLKSRFRRRLYNTLFFVDQNRPHRRAFDHTYHSCQREWALVNILRASEAHEPALAAAKSLLATCERYGFTALTAECARFLADAAADAGDLDAAERRGATAAQAARELHREVASAQAVRALRIRVAAAPSAGSPTGALPPGLAAGEAPDASPALRYDYLEARILLDELRGDAAAVSRGVEAVATYADAAPQLLRERRLRDLRHRQLRALAALGDRAAFRTAAAATETLCPAGSDAWHHLRRLVAAGELAIGDPALARASVVAALRHRSARHLLAPEREASTLVAALTHVVAAADLPAAAELLGDGPSFGRGYEALSAWRLVVEATFAQARSDGAARDAAVDALRGLAVRRLTRTRHPRLYAFAHVLTRQARHGFAGAPDRVARRYLRDLARAPFRLDVSPARFAPLDLARMLPAFGIDADESARAAA